MVPNFDLLVDAPVQTVPLTEDNRLNNMDMWYVFVPAHPKANWDHVVCRCDQNSHDLFEHRLPCNLLLPILV